jgi:hypothetical protein
MSAMFHPARRSNRKLRLALCGVAGSGKTMTAIKIAEGICRRIRLTEDRDATIGVVDTENGSAELYSGEYEFSVCKLHRFSPNNYVEAIKEAEKYFDVIILDSISPAWTGDGGALSKVDEIAKRQNGNTFGAWRYVTPEHNAMVDAMVRCKKHLIATMRSKVEYAQDTDGRGKTVIKKLGMAPIQREGMDYEFDVVGDLNIQHELMITKSRYSPMADRIIERPGETVGEELAAWLSNATPSDSDDQTFMPPASPGPEPWDPATKNHAPAPEPEPIPESAIHARVRELFTLLGMDSAKVRTALSRRGVSDVESLAPDQAAEMAAKMEGLLAQREAEAAEKKAAADLEAAQNANLMRMAAKPDLDGLVTDLIESLGTTGESPEKASEVEADPADAFTMPDQPRREAPEKKARKVRATHAEPGGEVEPLPAVA